MPANSFVDNLSSTTPTAPSTAQQIQSSTQQVNYTFTGTYTGLVGQIQGSMDGTNYVNLLGVRTDTGAGFNGTVGATNCSVIVTIGGWNYVRFLPSAIASGTVACRVDQGKFALPNGVTPISLTYVASTISSTSANAFCVGAAGTTNPGLNVDASASSAATGFNIASKAAGSGAALAVLSSGTNENGTIDAKGTGSITINGTATGNIIAGQLVIANAGITSGASTFPIKGQAGSSSAGGSMALTGGAGNGSGNAGGAITETGGAAGTGNAAGGAITHTGGLGAGSSAGGAVSSIGGASAASSSGNGGAVILTGGAVGSSGTGVGGAVTITSGAGASGGTAGSVTVDCGAANSGAAGTITIGGTNATSITLGSTTCPVVLAGPWTSTPGASTACAGTNAGTATALPSGTSSFYPTTAADGTKGVIITTSDKVTGREFYIGNGVSNHPLIVYPPTGGTINGGSASAAYTGASGAGVWVFCLSGSGNTWHMS